MGGRAAPGAMTSGGSVDGSVGGRVVRRRLRAALVAVLLISLLPFVTVASARPGAAAPIPTTDPTAPTTPAPGTPSDPEPSPGPTGGYRLGYASGDLPALAGVDPDTGRPQPAPVATTPAEEPGARAGGLVFVTHRPGRLDTDLSYRRPGASTATPLLADGFTDRHPQLSPDGGTVAFESDRGGQPDIWVVRVDGTGLRRITDHPADDTWPSWSPTGDRIAFASTRDDPAGDIHVVVTATGVTTRLTDDPAADTEPAWSATGRIAFTTGRFDPPGGAATTDVAVVAEAGGTVERLVPGEQAAWSPDGSRLAYVTRAADPAGDVAVLTVATPAPRVVAARPARGETQPTWDGPAVLYTDVTPGDGSADVWSADRDGQDRRDHTARPRADERAPAWSPDGRRLAYAEETVRTDGSPVGTRIVVADADGRDPRPLTTAEDFRHDRDPAWSPDGSMIAFSRTTRAGRSTVTVVRAADGAPVGTVAVPAALDADDAAPAWSADGSRIAFSRSSRVRPPSPITPGPTDRRLNPGGAYTVEQVIQTPALPPKPDVVLLVDTTGSMADTIADVRANLSNTVQAVQDAEPEARFAVVSYRDEDQGAELFRVLQGLTGDPAAIQAGVEKLVIGGGGDTPEAWANALFEVSTGAIGFRPDSSRIVVLVGDAPTHDPSNGRSLTMAIAALRAAAARVVAVDVGELNTEPSPPGCERGGCVPQATRVIGATGGLLMRGVDSGRVSEAVLTGLRNLDVTVTPTVRSCDTGLTVTFAPNRPTTVTGGQIVRYQQTVTLSPSAVPGTVLRCDVAYPNSPNPGGDGYLAPVVVHVNDPELPLVTVDDVTVTAGPGGAAVQFPATAVAADQSRPVPVCAPPSGSLFPVGQTLVTCTATDDAGRVGTDTALVTVVDPAADATTRIWVAALTPPDAGALTVTAQVDLSGRVGERCPAGRTDLAPAFSPDGALLAFTARGVLCTVGPDGAGARPLVVPAEGESAQDPAFAPDGTLVAYGLAQGGEAEHRSIRTVPVAGGTPTIVLDTPGEAFQPAFQVLSAGLALGVTAVPQRTPVGPGTITLTFTARNLATLSATRVWLSVDVPSLPRQAIAIGDLAAGATVTTTVDVPTTAPLAGPVLGVVDGVFPIEVPASARAQTDIEVFGPGVPPITEPPITEPPSEQPPTVVVPFRPLLRPVLTLEPAIGPPGFVAIVVGRGFPPGRTVRLAWSIGISAPTQVVAAADGTFRAQMLVFHRDQLGVRELIATGDRFVPASAPFLVVPGNQQPGDFVARR